MSQTTALDDVLNYWNYSGEKHTLILLGFTSANETESVSVMALTVCHRGIHAAFIFGILSAVSNIGVSRSWMGSFH